MTCIAVAVVSLIMSFICELAAYIDLYRAKKPKMENRASYRQLYRVAADWRAQSVIWVTISAAAAVAYATWQAGHQIVPVAAADAVTVIIVGYGLYQLQDRRNRRAGIVFG